MERKLAAIFSADVQGYSRLMGDDEEVTVRTLTTYRDLMTRLIDQHRGRVVDSPGDNLLAEFASVVEAVQCAVQIQQALKEKNAALPEHRKMAFRIGINLGDVLVEGERIYGDGVNIAARLEGLAEAGGICLSGTAYDQVKNKLALEYLAMGEHWVKNITDPLRVYRIQPEPRREPERASPKATASLKAVWRQRRKLAIVMVMVLLVGVGVRTLWHTYWHPSAPLLGKPSIAVLPFHNLSGNADQDYFADGMTDDLITDLSKVSGLSVIARNSSFTYKGHHVPVQQVAQELGVRYVLEGSVRHAGDTVRINAQLIDATSGHHLWAERYDRAYQGIFALQDEVTRKIVGALAITLTDAERSQLARRPTEHLEAYDLYLRAEHIRHHRTDNDNTGYRLALSLYDQAVVLDPQFAAAHAGVAWVAYRIWRGFRRGVLPADEARAQADQALSRALILDPDLPLAHIVQSKLYLVDGRHAAAITAAKHALSRDPNDVDASRNLAIALAQTGKLAEAKSAIETALRLNPKPGSAFHFQVGWALFYVHQYERAINHLEQATHARRTSVALGLAVNYTQLGRQAEAEAAYEEFRKWWPRANYVLYRLQFRYFQREVLDHFLDALHQAGMPEWPYDYEAGREVHRLDETEIKKVMFESWSGSTSRGRAYTVSVSADRRFVRRADRANGTEVVTTGTVLVEGDMYCLQSPQVMMGRPICGHVYWNPEGTPEEQNEYAWVDVFDVWYFSATHQQR